MRVVRWCHRGDCALHVEHVVLKSPHHGPRGTDRVSNLAIACKTCNEAKGHQQPEDWLARLQRSRRKRDQIRAARFPQVLTQRTKPQRCSTRPAGGSTTAYNRRDSR